MPAIQMLTNMISNRYLCEQYLRITPTTLQYLSEVIGDGTINSISKIEVIMIGLHFLAHGPTIREQCCLFGLSNHLILRARKEFVSQVNQRFAFYFDQRFWANNRVFDIFDRYSEFTGVFGAIDGTHVPDRVFEEETERYRNRKGVEGSAHDSLVLQMSGLIDIFDSLPPEFFVFGDAGYGLTKRILTPFRGVRYHLNEYSLYNQPRDQKELFNHRHSKCRNIVERTIGVLKRRWSLLRKTNESLDKEFINSSILACCQLHNFLISMNDMQFDPELVLPNNITYANDEENFAPNINESDIAKNWREEITRHMWHNYRFDIN